MHGDPCCVARYIGGTDGFLYALTRTGALVWRVALGGLVQSSPAVGADGACRVTADFNRAVGLLLSSAVPSQLLGRRQISFAVKEIQCSHVLRVGQGMY